MQVTCLSTQHTAIVGVRSGRYIKLQRIDGTNGRFINTTEK